RIVERGSAPLLSRGRALECGQSLFRARIQRDAGWRADIGDRSSILGGARPGGFRSRIQTVRRLRPDALITVEDPLTGSYTTRSAEVTARKQLPSLHGIREFVAAGGLMSYGANIADLFRRAAYYVDKIFTGAKPADLPVQQPTKFELVINLKTAKALG